MVEQDGSLLEEGAGDSAAVAVEHLGGIDTCEVAFEPGITILTGKNATNRTSLLRALGGILGGNTSMLKSDTDEGSVSLRLEDTEYTRTYTRTGTSIETSGTPYTDQETLVDLFVALLEDNPARRAVERGDELELHDIIMRPVDTDAIEQRIQQLRNEKQALEEEIDRVDERRAELPDLHARQQSLTEEIETLDEEINQLRTEVADIEASVEDVEGANELVDRLENRRQELTKTENRIEVVEAERDTLRDTLADLEAERANLSDTSNERREDLEGALAAARERKRSLDETITSLTTIVEFNEDILAEDGMDLSGVKPSTQDVTAALAPEAEQDVVCWTCGSRVQRGAIAERLDDLRTVISEKRSDRAEVKDEIDEIEDNLESIKQTHTRRQELDREIENTSEKIDQRVEQLTNHTDRREQFLETIADLEEEVASSEELRDSDLIEQYERISQLQYERGQTEQRLTDIESEIEAIETLSDPSVLEAQYDELTEQLERERGRIKTLETEAVEAFNTHMDEVLEILDYENVARVWIERKTTEQRRGSQTTVFDLHVIRESAEGTAYEDVIEHLSESEREVIGLVVALAGYLVHEAYEVVPFMLVDSIEPIDATRLNALLDYLANYTPYLVVAVLPEMAERVDETYERIPADQLG